MKTLLGFLTVILLLTLSIEVLASDKRTKVTYRWVDDNNIVQFTERPPKNRAYEKIIVTSSGGREVTQVTAEEASSDTKTETDATVDEVQKANARNCQIARQNMDVLRNIARIRVTENGQERILSPEEKEERIKDTQKQIDVFCKPAPAPDSGQ
jgi:hypothetical protein